MLGFKWHPLQWLISLWHDSGSPPPARPRFTHCHLPVSPRTMSSHACCNVLCLHSLAIAIAIAAAHPLNEAVRIEMALSCVAKFHRSSRQPGQTIHTGSIRPRVCIAYARRCKMAYFFHVWREERQPDQSRGSGFPGPGWELEGAPHRVPRQSLSVSTTLVSTKLAQRVSSGLVWGGGGGQASALLDAAEI